MLHKVEKLMFICLWAATEGAGGLLGAAFQYLQGGNQEGRAKLFTQMRGRRIHNSHKLNRERFQKKKNNTMRIMKNWNRHPESLWDLSPWRFSGRNWITLSNLLWFQCWPRFEEQVGTETSQGSFQFSSSVTHTVMVKNKNHSEISVLKESRCILHARLENGSTSSIYSHNL